jgi:hypothetical protein
MIHWLVAQGAVRDLVSAGILVPIMHVVAGRPLRRVARALEAGARDARRDVAQNSARRAARDVARRDDYDLSV